MVAWPAVSVPDDVTVCADLVGPERSEEAEDRIEQLHRMQIRCHDPWRIDKAGIEKGADEGAVLVEGKRGHGGVVAPVFVVVDLALSPPWRLVHVC